MKTRNILHLCIAAVIILLGGCASFKKVPAPADVKAFSDYGSAWAAGFSEEAGLNYIVTHPEGYDPGGEKWPLILFLHSMEERGEDLGKLFNHPGGEGAGLAEIALETPGFPFVTISPLSPDGTGWSLFTDRIKMLIDEIIDSEAVDPERIYVTGVSMGGMGVWSFITDYPDVPAAAAPISGGIYPPMMRFDFEAVRKVPVWAFHDLYDPNIPIEDEMDMINGLREHGGDIEYTITEKHRHYIHEDIYRGGELFRWFLDYKRGE